MSVFHLLWIVPVSWMFGVFTTVMCVMADRADMEDADFYEGSAR